MTSTQLFSHSLKQVPVPAPPHPIHVGLSEGQHYKKDRANFYFVDKGMEVGYAG